MQNEERLRHRPPHSHFCIRILSFWNSVAMSDKAFRRLYAAVIAELALLILIFYAFTRHFS